MAQATLDDLRRLLSWLDSDLKNAWEIYFLTRGKLVMFFRDCPSPIDLADEALDRIARRKSLDDIRDFRAFAHGVARTMKSERKKDQVPIDGLRENGPVSRHPDPGEVIDRQRQKECFRCCVNALGPQERRLFLAYKLTDDDTRTTVRQKLAAENGISANTLGVRVFRIENRVKQCARHCLENRGKVRM